MTDLDLQDPEDDDLLDLAAQSVHPLKMNHTEPDPELLKLQERMREVERLSVTWWALLQTRLGRRIRRVEIVSAVLAVAVFVLFVLEVCRADKGPQEALDRDPHPPGAHSDLVAW